MKWRKLVLWAVVAAVAAVPFWLGDRDAKSGVIVTVEGFSPDSIGIDSVYAGATGLRDTSNVYDVFSWKTMRLIAYATGDSFALTTQKSWNRVNWTNHDSSATLGAAATTVVRDSLYQMAGTGGLQTVPAPYLRWIWTQLETGNQTLTTKIKNAHIRYVVFD